MALPVRPAATLRELLQSIPDTTGDILQPLFESIVFQSSEGLMRLDGSPVSAGGVSGSDTRKLASWFAGGLDGQSALFVGDSTSEQLAGSGRVAYAGGYLLGNLEPSLIGRVSFKNRGINGASLATFVSAGTANNSGGMPSKLDDICAELMTLTRPLVVLCYGINDVRQNAAIAGSTYGNAAQVTAATAIRANLVTACSRMAVANPGVSIILRMPNAFAPTASGLLVNGVTGQNAMDVLRLAYRGDSALSLPPIDLAAGGSTVLFDTLRLVYGDTSYANLLINSDGLHPSAIGYDRTLAALLRLIAGPEAATLGSAAQYAAAARYERSVGHGPQRPREINDIKLSGEWQQITACSVVNATGSYFDLGLGSTAAIAWGAASAAAYGSAAQPQVGVGDVIVLEPAGLPAVIIPVGRMGDQLNGPTVRWFSGGPDGYYPSATDLPAGTQGTIWRHRWSGTDNARRNSEALAAGGVRRASAKPLAYHAFVTSATNGSITLRGIGGQATSLAAHTMSTTDTICLAGVDDSSIGGVPLTGATFSGPDTTTGVLTITLAGRDFTKFAFRQVVILSAT